MHPYIQIFGRNISVYGICCVLGVFLGLLLLFFWSHKKRNIARNDSMYCSAYALIGALIGAKVLFLIVELPTIIADPSVLFYMIFGGFVFYGGVIGGIVGAWIYARHYKVPLIAYFDVAAPSLALGQAVGRVGCFMAGCCYGMEVEGPFSVYYPPGGAAPAGVPLLATQLMETAFLLLLTVALLIILAKSKKVGVPLAIYFISYGVWRFIIEFFRSDPRGSVGALSTSQFISIFIVLAGILILCWDKLKQMKQNGYTQKSETEKF